MTISQTRGRDILSVLFRLHGQIKSKISLCEQTTFLPKSVKLPQKTFRIIGGGGNLSPSRKLWLLCDGTWRGSQSFLPICFLSGECWWNGTKPRWIPPECPVVQPRPSFKTGRWLWPLSCPRAWKTHQWGNPKPKKYLIKINNTPQKNARDHLYMIMYELKKTT